jgi:hypothetical protein
VPSFKDADGVRWSVRRRWWPLLGALDMASWGDSVFGVIMFLLALPVILTWPLWMLAKLCGVPWKIAVHRDGDEVRTEKVSGWRASKARIDEICAEIRADAEPDPLHDHRPYR